MRTLIDFDDAAIAALDRIARQEKVSRSALVREAVAAMIERRVKPDFDEAFGLWASEEASEDGLRYQRELRAQW
ncbi:putative transcriptional regulator [Neorhizobium galegae]|uniref:ribbon-helix-helix domain-containing protein n=1 Tax=Neorhizobium galegae TaxID=399 RepID=UPI001AE4327D|nr:putative transcriptional regulator [Neorhizobium galegae]